MQSFIGTGVALVTPFNTNGTIDTTALENLVERSVKGGVDYLVVNGTTAESVTLTKEEKELIIQTIRIANAGRVPLVLGIGGNNTQAVVAELQDTNLTVFDAILSVSPYYNKPTQEGIYQHFKEIALASSVPVLLYNIPGRTGSNMLPSTIVRLAKDFSNIIGVKESAGDLLQAMELIRTKPKGFLVISGDDKLALPIILAGGHGVISVIAQGYPEKFSELIRFGLNQNVKEAYDLLYQFIPIIDMIFEQGNPAGIKEVLSLMKVCHNSVRLPLVAVNEDLANRIYNFVKKSVI